MSTSIYFVGPAVVTQLEGRTLGLVGLGAIGSRVAVLARPFGMRLLAATFGSYQGRAAALGAQHVPVEQLLREADIVSLHLRLSADTQGYLGKARLALMKPTAFLINTARGGLVDKQVLIDALRDQRWPARRSASFTRSRSCPAIPSWPCPSWCSRPTTAA